MSAVTRWLLVSVSSAISARRWLSSDFAERGLREVGLQLLKVQAGDFEFPIGSDLEWVGGHAAQPLTHVRTEIAVQIVVQH